jgi:hypothetical protein
MGRYGESHLDQSRPRSSETRKGRSSPVAKPPTIAGSSSTARVCSSTGSRPGRRVRVLSRPVLRQEARMRAERAGRRRSRRPSRRRGRARQRRPPRRGGVLPLRHRRTLGRPPHRRRTRHDRRRRLQGTGPITHKKRSGGELTAKQKTYNYSVNRIGAAVCAVLGPLVGEAAGLVALSRGRGTVATARSGFRKADSVAGHR